MTTLRLIACLIAALLPALDLGTWVILIGLPWALFTGMFKDR